MITGIYQSIPCVVTIVLYYILDMWLMRRYNVKRGFTEKRDTPIAIATVAAILLIVSQSIFMPSIGIRITARWGLLLQLTGLACVAMGLILVLWARSHLQNLFSEWLELQPGHRVVNTGPYAWVRHPLYTAYMLIALGLLFIKPSIIELAILGFVIWYFSKLVQQEEALLGEALPGYTAYMATTPRFVPSPWYGRAKVRD